MGARSVGLRLAAAARNMFRESRVMLVQVEIYFDERGAEKLRRFHLDDRTVEVATSGMAQVIATSR